MSNRTCIYGFVVFLFAIGLNIAQAGLIHRYSFGESTVKDSVGKVDGKLKGDGAKIADGKLTLKNEGLSSSDDKMSYLEFAGPVLPKEGSASIVFWFNAKDVGNFARIVNFGSSEGGEGKAFIYFTPHTEGGQTRAAISATDTAGRIFVDNDPLDDGKTHMVAVVIDGTAKKLHVYIDGKEPKPAEDLGENTLDKVKPVENWIGRSSFSNDAGLTASIDEFRVYDNALSAEEAAAIEKAGPEALPAAK